MKSIKKVLEEMTPEEFEFLNNQDTNQAKLDHDRFVNMLVQGKCSLCGQLLSNTELNKPCEHWLLLPMGIKKQKHLMKLLFTNKGEHNQGYFRIVGYLRWLANTEGFLKNINDLKSEVAERKLVETTIKYKDIEWSFSIDPSDYQGHLSGNNSNYPHYHLQIKKNGYVVVKFNDFHIPIKEEDLHIFQAMIDIPNFKINYPGGESIQNMFDMYPSSEILDHVKVSDNVQNATFNTSTMIFANNGKSFSGDEILDLINESKLTKTPIAVIAKKNLKNASILSAIEPGQIIPEMSKRSKTSNR